MNQNHPSLVTWIHARYTLKNGLPILRPSAPVIAEGSLSSCTLLPVRPSSTSGETKEHWLAGGCFLWVLVGWFCSTCTVYLFFFFFENDVYCYLLCMGVCVHACLCTVCAQCSWRPEECVGSLGAGVTSSKGQGTTRNGIPPLQPLSFLSSCFSLLNQWSLCAL